MPIKQFRCVTTSLAIRTQPQLGDQFRTSLQLKMGDVISSNDDTRRESGGYLWLQHERGWSAERTVDGKQIFLLDASLKPKDKMWGINIDPYNPAGKPPASKLAGVGWARFVFHASSKRQTVEQAFAFYDPIIRDYSQAGIKILLIIIHDTYLGNSPWHNGGWDQYIPGYADALGKIARRYRGQVAAYEIWNEGDLPAEQQSIPTSVYVPPEPYAQLLVAASRAVRQADPAAKVISGGLVSGSAIQYMTKVSQQLGGNIPVDGIGIHPYGQTIPEAQVFPGWSRGSLTDYLNRFSQALPGYPLWITEYGVPRVDVNNTNFWPPIANYMLKTFQLMRATYFHLVPVVIWFAWADSMDHAGIVKDSQEPKGIQFDTFFRNVRDDQPGYTRSIDAPYNGKIMVAYAGGQNVAENSIAEVVKRISTSAANVGAVIVRSSTGLNWAAAGDPKPAMAIGGPSDLQRWSSELSRYRLDLHAWHELVGKDIAAETALAQQAALAPGVSSLIIDLDASRLAIRNATDIRNFMIGLKRGLPATFHVGASFDGRAENMTGVLISEWFPFISSWHPKVFHWLYGNQTMLPQPYLVGIFNALKPYPRPIIPMLQAEPTNGKPVPIDHIRQAAKFAFEQFKSPALSFYRFGGIGPAEYGAIQSTIIPYTAGLSDAPKGQDVMAVVISSPLRIRANPSTEAPVVGTLQPGEQIVVQERSVIGALLWVRHSRGWTLAKNGQTGEIFLA